MLRKVPDDARSRLPPEQPNVSRSVLAERILKAAQDREFDRPVFEPAQSNGASRRHLRPAIASGLRRAGSSLLGFDRGHMPDILDIALKKISYLFHRRAERETVPEFGKVNRRPRPFLLS